MDYKNYGYEYDLKISQKQLLKAKFKKLKKDFRFNKWILLLILIIFLSIFGVKTLSDNLIEDVANAVTHVSMHEEPQTMFELKEEGVLSASYVTNILLIATDKRLSTDIGRSDVMMLLSYNKSSNRFHLVSFQRDLYVPIYKQNTSNRLNASYAYGGPECTMKTIEDNFKFDIDHFVAIDMFSAADFIDAIGGLDINITSEETQYINQYMTEINYYTGHELTDSLLPNDAHGIQHLNGRQTLNYCRIRYLDGGDFGRTNRQRITVNAIITKIKEICLKPQLWKSTYSNLLDALSSISTDMKTEDMEELISLLPLFLGSEFSSHSIPADTTWNYEKISGMEIIECDFEKNHKYLKNILY